MADSEQSETLRSARQHAEEALAVLGRLKTGSWESVQALALVSIAESLLVLSAGNDSSGQ